MPAASQFSTLDGGCLEVSFGACWKSKPRLSREVCEDPLAMSARGLGGGSGGATAPNRHKDLRSTSLRVLILTSSPIGVWSPKKPSC